MTPDSPSTPPAPEPLRLLVADDDQLVRDGLRRVLTAQGHTVVLAQSEQEAVETYLREGADVALVDLVFPTGPDTGFRLVRRLKTLNEHLPVILMTGNEDVAHARQALDLKVFDFLTKPASAQALLFKLARAAEHLRLSRDRDLLAGEVAQLKRATVRDMDLGTAFGKSPVMARLRKQVERLSVSGEVTVLITGESGTGKEVMARTLHSLSPRSGKPFVAVNCAGIPETLFETEFFGHLEGAFTDAKKARRGYFEMASGGTLFLDEVGELPLNLQAKILRAIEDRRIRRVGAEADLPVDVRILCATNRPLQDMVAAKTFRDDLFYRLAVMEIHLPPLRDRREDVLDLALFFLNNFRAAKGEPPAVFSPVTAQGLMAYNFPGNIRELKNLMERVSLLMEGSVVEPGDLLLPVLNTTGQGGSSPLPGDDLNLEDMERRVVAEALRRTGGNQTKAARLLGIGHDALRYKMKKFTPGQ